MATFAASAFGLDLSTPPSEHISMISGASIATTTAEDDFSLLSQRLLRQEFEHLLESMGGVKELVVEGSLMRPLDRLLSMQMLREHECPRVQQLHMDRALCFADGTEHGIFLVRLTIPFSKKICELILATQQRNSGGAAAASIRLSVVCVDGRKGFFERELEKNGIYGTVSLHEFSFFFVPLEHDLLSLELPLRYARAYRQESALLASALWRLQTLYGSFQQSGSSSTSATMFGCGELARQTDRCFQRLHADHKQQASAAKSASAADAEAISLSSSEKGGGGLQQDSDDWGSTSADGGFAVDMVIMFDRHLDIPCVLLTGMTYESLLNDVFAYNCGKIVFGDRVRERLKAASNKTAASESALATAARVLPLSNADPIFAAIRDAHMTAALPFLGQKAKTLQHSVEKALEINKVDEMKAFVANELRALREQQRTLDIHISAAEVLAVESSKAGMSERCAVEWALVRGEFDHVEVLSSLRKFIDGGRQGPWPLLQLACLWSLRAGGLPIRCYQQFEDAFLRRHGVEFLPAFVALRRRGILHAAPSGGGTIAAARQLLPTSKKFSAAGGATTQTDAQLQLKQDQQHRPSSSGHTTTSTSVAGGGGGGGSSSFACWSGATRWDLVIKELRLSTHHNKPSNNSSSGKEVNGCGRGGVAASDMFNQQSGRPSYVFSDEYTPVVCRLFELALREQRQRALLSAQLATKSRQQRASSTSSAATTTSTSNASPLIGFATRRLHSVLNKASSTDADSAAAAAGGGGSASSFKSAFTSSFAALKASSSSGAAAAEKRVSGGGGTSASSWDCAKLRRIFALANGAVFSRFGLTSSCNSSPGASAIAMPRTVLVCFAGGVTFAEVAALRCLARCERVRLVILTTGLLHREQFMQTAAELFI